MKKLLLLLITFIAGISLTNAGTIAPGIAQTVAQNFYNHYVPAKGTNFNLVYTEKATDGITPVYYVFNVDQNKGFIIVSADDAALPILGYSNTGHYETSHLSPEFAYWMNGYKKQIAYIKANNIQTTAEIKGKWQAYKSNKISNQSQTTQSVQSVNPLVSTLWDQSPYYNDYCPGGSVTGCVATAMAQIMKYWDYPCQGTGSHSYCDCTANGFSSDYGTLTANFGATTYNWSAMPSYLSSSNTDVATLMYDCGVSVEMDYTPSESGAWVITSDDTVCAQTSYVRYFGYDASTIQGLYKSNYADAAWVSLIENELINSRPVQYVGTDTVNGGHTWVCDGFDVNNLFHMNWGWSGSDNGYFALNALNPQGLAFNTDEEAVIGIQPATYASSSSFAICSGDSTQIGVQSIAGCSYSWSPTTGLSSSTVSNPTAKPTATTTYTLTENFSGGCNQSITATVTIANIGVPSEPGPITGNTTVCSGTSQTYSITPVNGAVNYTWTLPSGWSGTSTSESINTIVNTVGAISVVANGCGGSSPAQTLNVNLPAAPTPNPVTISCGSSATLTASGSDTLKWYDQPTGGTLLYSGSSYVTPALNSNATYYVESDVQPATVNCGPADDSFGGGGIFTYSNIHYETFDCNAPCTLVSVLVYAQGAGYRTISLWTSLGTALDSAVVYIPNGQSRVTLNFNIPAAKGLELGMQGNTNLYRNNGGAVFPYNSPGGYISITGADVGGGYYYYFYDWEIAPPACASARAAATVNVNPLPAAFTDTAVGNTVKCYNLSPSATSYLWKFGDGNSSTQPNPVYTYSSAGTYTITLYTYSGACTDSSSSNINLIATGISSLNSKPTLDISPNPAIDRLYVNLNTSEAGKTWTIKLYNVLGQAVNTSAFNSISGINQTELNLSGLTEGVYILELQSKDAKLIRKIVKE